MSLVPVTLRNATDTYTSEARVTENFALNTQLRIRSTGSSTGMYAWVYFSRPFPLGAQILDAKLRLFVSGAWAANGSRSVLVERVLSSWKVGQLKWSNQPSTTSLGTINLGTTTGAQADGTKLEADVTAQMQLISNGTAWYGFRIHVTGETNVLRFYAAQAAQFKPVLAITYAEAPDAPTILSPGGGRSVSLTKPKVRFDFTDPSGTTAITSAEIQLDAADVFGAGVVMQRALVNTAVPEIDLNAISAFDTVHPTYTMDFETSGAIGWLGTNTTPTIVTTAPRNGLKHMSMTATAGATMSAQSAVGTGAFRVRGSTGYTFAAFNRTAVTSRTTNVAIDWYDSAGVFISTSTGSGSANSTSYASRSVSATSPSNAAFARPSMTVTTPLAAEVHYWDDLSFQLSWVGLADAESIFYRVRVTDDAGLTSAWSDSTKFRRDTQGTLAVNNPAVSPNNFVQEATPPITWLLSGRTQAAWQVIIADALGNHLYSSGKVTGIATSHTLPHKILHDGITYTLIMKVWDTLTRESIPGDPAAVVLSRDFTYNLSATVTVISAFTGTDLSPEPGVQLDWTRATAPDSFTLVRDGKVIRAGILPGEVFVSGTSYRLVDRSASPRNAHVWEVRAVVNGVTSTANPQVTKTLLPLGVWIMDDIAGTKVQLLGKDQGSWDMPEQSASYLPVGAQKGFRIVQGLSGYVVDLSGMRLVAYGGVTVAQAEAILFAMKAQSSREFRIVLADLNLPVTLSAIVSAPTPNPEIERVVSLHAEQSDDFPVKLSI